MFKELENIIPENATLSITITVMPGNKMSVVTAWKGKDEYSEINKIPSVIMVGTATELDTEFLKNAIQPLKKSSGIVSNLSFYEKELEAIKKKSTEKLAKAIKDESKKKTIPAKLKQDDDFDDDPIPGNKIPVKDKPLDLFSSKPESMPDPNEVLSPEEEIIPEPNTESDPWDTGISSNNTEPLIGPDGEIL